MTGFPRENRITRGPDLQRMLREGKRVRTRFLDVRISASPLSCPQVARIGIIVPKAKHTAVHRNQLKRRLRELARTILIAESSPHDIVIIARADTYRASFDLLMTDVQNVFHTLQADRPNRVLPDTT